jgi:NAD(P)-dependent dehydrogenase (short-subunit alcohol dehydrogenase family)
MIEKLLEGQVAIITGGASGIGRAIGKAFLQEGAHVAIFDINLNLVKTTVTELSPLGQIKGFGLDIADLKLVEKVVREVEVKFGPVTTLVNNAGIGNTDPKKTYSLENIPSEEWKKVLTNNLFGAFNCTQIVGQCMIAYHTKGSIIFITSNHNYLVFPEASAYRVSKAGIRSLMEDAAVEWGKYGIRSNAIAPGATAPTGINPLGIVTKGQRVMIPLERHAHPSEIANIAVFLASTKSSYISGSEIVADGGQRLKAHILK